MMTVEDLKRMIDKFSEDTILKVGNGRREIPVEEIFYDVEEDKLVFGTESYVKWKERQEYLLGE